MNTKRRWIAAFLDWFPVPQGEVPGMPTSRLRSLRIERLSRLLVAFACMSLIAVVFAACGGDDESGSTKTAAAADPASSEPTKLTAGALAIVGNMPLFLA